MGRKNESLYMSYMAFHRWEIKTQWVTVRFFKGTNNFEVISVGQIEKSKWYRLSVSDLSYLSPES